MKSIAFTFAAFTLLIIVGPTMATAQTAGQSSNGIYQFYLDDKTAKNLDYNAKTQADGTTVGQMYLSDEALISNQDVDGTKEPGSGDRYNGFYIKADLDELVIDNKNQAVMSGTVRDSSIINLIGQRVLLTVEDNGADPNTPDKLTWGLYQFVERRWTPSDAELKDDPGVGLRWWATDAERKDDVGIPQPKQDEQASTRSFPVSTYAFVNMYRGSGDIVVQP